MSSFFFVRHSFKIGGADHWWATFADLASQPEKFAEWTKKTHELGFHNHSFLPSGPASNAFCVWEAREGKTPAEFQTFIDGENGPSFGVLMNECLPIRLDLAGNPPFKSFFAAEAQAPAEAPTSDSTFFIIHHAFLQGKAAEWWATFANLASEPAKMAAFQKAQLDAGFFGHAFMPTGEASDCYCLWEARAGKTAAEMQTFIDGPLGPSFGCFANAVVPIDLALCNGAPELARKFTEYSITARFTAKEGKLDETLAFLKEKLPETVSYDGCIMTEMYRDATKPNEIVMWGKWESKAHHDRYMAWRKETGDFANFSALLEAPPAIMPLRRSADGEARRLVRTSGFTVLAKFTAAEGKKAELMQTLAEAFKCTHKYAGNHAMEMYTDDADANAIYLWEQWDKEETFKSYFKMRTDTGFIAKLMPMLAAPPAPAPLVVEWSAPSSPKLRMENAKAVDKKLRLASPHHAAAAAPLSPMNRVA